ncbi:MAG: PAS domain S-box protein [Alphaproteobacteria bacterium]|nr:PAS domain S-box protein [Alphaproteobacteria bacterium]
MFIAAVSCAFLGILVVALTANARRLSGASVFYYAIIAGLALLFADAGLDLVEGFSLAVAGGAVQRVDALMDAVGASVLGQAIAGIGLIGWLLRIARTQLALADSEARYRAISEMSWGYAYAYHIDASGRLSGYWATEEAHERLTGYKFAEIQGGFRLYHPDDAERARRDVASTIAGRPTHGVYRIVAKDGRVRWHAIRRHVERDLASGRVARLFGAVQDITDQKLAEEALRDSERRYRTVTEMLWGYAFAFTVDEQGKPRTEWVTNDAFERVTGLAWDSHGATFGIYHPLDRERGRADFAETVAGRPKHGEYRIVASDGQTRWLAVRRHIELDPQGMRVVRVYGAAEDITDRKLAEQALKDSEQRFRDFAEIASDWFWEQDSALRFVDVGEANASVSGMSAAAHLGRTRRETAPLDVSAAEWAAHEADLAARRPFKDFRFTRIDPAGRRRTIMVSGKPVFDDAGTFQGYRGIGRDVTAFVELQQRIGEADARLVHAIESLDESFVLTDPQDRVLVCNRYARRLNPVLAEPGARGMHYADLLRRSVALGFQPEAMRDPEAWVAERLAQRRAGRDPVEVQAPDGTWLLVRDERLPDGCTATVALDITDRVKARQALQRANEELEAQVRQRTLTLEAEIADRKAAQGALAKSEARLRDIVQASSDWFWELDADLRVVSFSDPFLDVMGLRAEDVVGRHYSAWAPRANARKSAQEQWSALAAALESRKPFRNIEYQLRSARGDTVISILGGVPIVEDGAFSGIRGSGTNITALRQAQDALVQSEKMASIATMVAGLSHEINTPLGVAVTAASHLSDRARRFQEEYSAGPLRRSALDRWLEDCASGLRIVESNLKRSAQLIRSLKEMSVDQASDQSRTINPKAYLEEIVGNLSPQFRRTPHRVEIEGPDDLEMVTFPGALSQIVANLLLNSLVHAFDDDRPGRVVLSVRALGDTVEITCADDGKGAPDEVMQRMFEPFFTTRRGQGGSGLGLSIVYHLVTQKLGGQIKAQGSLGHGLAFVITLPRAAARRAA